MHRGGCSRTLNFPIARSPALRDVVPAIDPVVDQDVDPAADAVVD
jgi:hypothetical protein